MGRNGQGFGGNEKAGLEAEVMKEGEDQFGVGAQVGKEEKEVVGAELVGEWGEDFVD